MQRELLGGRLPAVGGTPLVPVRLRTGRRWHPVWLKLEQFNPGGSIKDRTAWSLIADLEARGALRPGGTVVESTSGNLGVGLALACRERGYRLIAVVDQMASARSVREMTGSGAVIDTVTPGPGEPLLACRLSRVAELLRADPDLVWTNQYASPANPGVHREQTATEICRQLGRPPGAVAVAVSTGGTLQGIAEHLRACAPGCRSSPWTPRAPWCSAASLARGTPRHRVVPALGLPARQALRPRGLRVRGDGRGHLPCPAGPHRHRGRRLLGGGAGRRRAVPARPGARRAGGVRLADGADRYEDTVYDVGWLARNEIAVTSALPLPFDDITPG